MIKSSKKQFDFVFCLDNMFELFVVFHFMMHTNLHIACDLDKMLSFQVFVSSC